MKLPKINLDKLEAILTTEIKGAGGLPIPGPEKMQFVLDAVCRKIDQSYEPNQPALEAVSDVAISGMRWALEAIAQARYDKLKAEGLIAN